MNENITLRNSSSNNQSNLNDIDESDFSYEGYQVVRAEFFAHLFEPSVTFNRETVAVNQACLRKLSEYDYVQFLVNPAEKKLAVKPCTEDRKDSFRWSSGEGRKRKPKKITCKIFFAKVMDLMGWDPKYRYKVLGKLIRSKEDCIFIFDLTSAEAYQNRSKGTPTSQAPLYPEDWKNQFGVPATEHQDIQQISIFDDYTVFKIERSEETRKEINRNGDESCKSTGNNNRSEKAENSDSQ